MNLFAGVVLPNGIESTNESLDHLKSKLHHSPNELSQFQQGIFGITGNFELKQQGEEVYITDNKIFFDKIQGKDLKDQKNINQSYLEGVHFIYLKWDGIQLSFRRCDSGTHPLYYTFIGKGLVFSTRIKPILSYLNHPVALNREYLSAYCQGHWFGVENETFFKGIFKLRPHNEMFFNAKDGTFRQQPLPFPRSESILDIDHAVQLFKGSMDSVLNSTSNKGRIAVSLSGGIDSSVIQNVAARELKKENVLGLNYFEAHGVGDEREYVDLFKTEQSLKIESFPVCGVPSIEEWLKDIELTEMPYIDERSYNLKVLFEKANAFGADTVLTGHGGDHLFDQASVWLDEVFSGHWLRALKFSKGYIQKSDYTHKDFLKMLKWELLHPFAPATRGIVKTLKPAQSIFSNEFLSLAQENSYSPLGQTPSVKDLYRFYQSPSTELKLEWGTKLASDMNIHFEHPFLNRRIVDLSMSIPGRWRMLNFEPKGFLRYCYKDELPAGIIQRQGKGNYSESFLGMIHALRKEIKPILLDDPLLVKMNIVHKEKYTYTVNQLLNLEEKEACLMAWDLLEWLGLELFLRVFFSKSSC